MRRGSRVVIVVLLLSFACGTVFAETDLYGPKGITPQAVKQGGLGSCYFHASIAALALTRPETLRAAIRQDESGKLKVRFADGKIENVYPEDVQFARDSGYDHSDGLWVAVLFRAFAQRMLRDAMLGAIKQTTLLPQIKTLAGLAVSSDLVLLAYDRAIRLEIDQAGAIDSDHLKARLRKELQPLPIDDQWKERALDLLDASGFVPALQEKVKATGELFGAFRAVGQGGLPEQVLTAFSGKATAHMIKNGDESAAAIATALRNHHAVVACAGDSPAQSLMSKWRSLFASGTDDWFVADHAYTVLSVDTQARTIRLRNPWGERPAPGGEFTLPLDVFSSAYERLSTAGDAQTSSSTR